MSKKKIFSTITAISFNNDGSKVAICAGEQEVYIFDTNGKTDPSKWTKQHELKEHTLKATAIDWNPQQPDTLVTGSIDRSIFVWKYNDEHAKYVPEFVNVDEKLAILDLKWSKQGTKFCLSSSSKKLFVGFYKAENNWWATVEIKKQHKSSILSCEFSPNGRVIASASLDGTCKIISAYVPNVDDAEEAKGAFGTVDSFGTCLIEFKCQFWLNCVTWSPSGNSICYCSHDGTLNFCDVSEEKKGKIDKFTHKGLPFAKGRYIDEDTFVAAGYDKVPFVFTKSGSWDMKGSLDDGFEVFRDFSAKAGSKEFYTMKELESDIKIPEKILLKERDTKHENTIQQLVFSKPGSTTKELCTCDDNGNIYFWKV